MKEVVLYSILIGVLVASSVIMSYQRGFIGGRRLVFSVENDTVSRLEAIIQRQAAMIEKQNGTQEIQNRTLESQNQQIRNNLDAIKRTRELAEEALNQRDDARRQLAEQFAAKE